MLDSHRAPSNQPTLARTPCSHRLSSAAQGTRKKQNLPMPRQRTTSSFQQSQTPSPDPVTSCRSAMRYGTLTAQLSSASRASPRLTARVLHASGENGGRLPILLQSCAARGGGETRRRRRGSADDGGARLASSPLLSLLWWPTTGT